jgi:homospermidine synthase
MRSTNWRVSLIKARTDVARQFVFVSLMMQLFRYSKLTWAHTSIYLDVTSVITLWLGFKRHMTVDAKCKYSIVMKNTVLPVYNDIGLYNTSLIESDILWCQLIHHC